MSRAALWPGGHQLGRKEMLIHDDIYYWKGWGGNLSLGRGMCRLRIFDLKKGAPGPLAHLKSTIVVVEDVEESPLSVRGFVGHIATCVARDFGVDPTRMLMVEYYPRVTYGEKRQHSIGEKYEAVEFSWHEDKAIHPKWRPLPEPTKDMIREMLSSEDNPEGPG